MRFVRGECRGVVGQGTWMITSNVIKEIVANKEGFKLCTPLGKGGWGELFINLGRDIESDQGSLSWRCWCGNGVVGIKDRVLVRG